MKKVLTLFALCALTPLALTACGSKSKTTPTTPASTPSTPTSTTTTAGGAATGGGATLQLAADASALKFDKTALSAKAGQVTIDFTNPSAIGHDVTVEAAGDKEVAKTSIITQSKATLTANLKAGTYTFYCSVPGHKDAGMQGTLTVQ